MEEVSRVVNLTAVVNLTSQSDRMVNLTATVVNLTTSRGRTFAKDTMPFWRLLFTNDSSLFSYKSTKTTDKKKGNVIPLPFARSLCKTGP